MKHIIIMGVFLLLLASFSNAWFFTPALVRNNLTIENYGTSTLSNFPALVKVNVTNYGGSCSNLLLINATDNTVLKYHTENNTCSYNNVALIWANAETLNANSNNTFGKLYHNSTESIGDNSSLLEVFDSNYVYVFHADSNETYTTNYKPYLNATTLVDSYWTQNGIFGGGIVGIGNNSAQGTGIKVLNGWKSGVFNSQNFTFEIWFNMTDSTTRTLALHYNTGTEMGINLNQVVSGSIRFYSTGSFDNFGTGANVLVANTTEYLALTVDATTAKIYLNGVNIQNLSIILPLDLTTADLSIGSGGSGGLSGFKGIWDEVRISNITRSADYVRNVWNNRNGVTIGADELFMPTIFINDPANITYTKFLLYLNVSVDTQTIDVWKYSLNGGANVTFSPNTTFIGTQGSNTIIVSGTNENGTGTLTRRFTINTPPTITILAPIATTYTDPNITLTISFNDTDPSQFWYSLNGGANVTFTQNTTSFTANPGLNSITAYMNDTFGSRRGSQTVNFTFNSSFVPPVTPTSAPSDPNVLLFIVVLAIIMIGLFWLTR
jgi:hypothetical protein